jgi:hypothetical protein
MAVADRSSAICFRRGVASVDFEVAGRLAIGLYQLSVLSDQFSAISSQRSVLSYQFSATSHQPSAISFSRQLSVGFST